MMITRFGGGCQPVRFSHSHKPEEPHPAQQASRRHDNTLPPEPGAASKGWVKRAFFGVGTWFKEFFSGLFKDLKTLLKGPETDHDHEH